jgi:hypothetical protein
MKIFNFLQGPDGEQSSKRVFTFIMMVLWVVYFFANLFGGYVLKETLEEYLFYIVIITYGGVAAEGWKNVFKRSGVKPDSSSTTVTKKEEVTEVKKTDN